MSAIRVLVADDHAPTRAELCEMLGADGRFEVVAEAGNAAVAVKEAVRTRPDLCVLDVHMPGGGIPATWEITARLPESKVVMFTVSAADADLFAALRAGAVGYLLKDTDPADLPDELAGVLTGDAAMPPALVSRVIGHFRDRAPRRRTLSTAVPLTSREWEVLDLMAGGRTNAQIGRVLGVSPITVRTHVANVLRKLRVPDRDSAVRLFTGGDLDR